MRLSVIVPCYNEVTTLATVLERIRTAPLDIEEREVVVIDDGSTDGSRELLVRLAAEHPEIRALFHATNRGKGAALRLGFAAAHGDILVVQDADLEYDPADYPRLLAPLLDGEADVVFGSRFLDRRAARGSRFAVASNRFATALANLLTGLHLTDVETCYKVLDRAVLERLHLDEDGFGFDPEITIKLAGLRPRIRLREVPVRYVRRNRTQGKKLRLRDALYALLCFGKHAWRARAAHNGTKSSQPKAST